ncbi:MAG: sugar phosphate isomerase/epimerase [Anaerolineae bacterium]|nr:sugar phosphate isomerase/epimerase [Anaerolineae bacterium]
MLYSGLVSITFRALSTIEIIDLARTAGIQGIEWGGDVHVPPGDMMGARDVKHRTEDAGLRVSAYGSYYRLRRVEQEEHPFEAVLATAVGLGAPFIRVWAGNQPSETVGTAERARIAAESRRIADLAAAQGIGIAYEFHGNTLTDRLESALDLLQAVDHPNISTFWQPPNGMPPQESRAGLDAVAPWVTNIHCFHWWPTSKDRHTLADGEANWTRYGEKIAALPGDRFVSIEFVKNDAPEQFLQDAATLKQWLARWSF